MRDKFIEVLEKEAKKNKNIILLTADLGFKIFDKFKITNPDQIINVGISEQNMAGLATGLALCGKKVFCYSIANFTVLRSIEYIRNGPCYHDLDVKFVSGGTGYSYGSLGYTHHAIEDISIIKSLPNIDIFSPSTDYEIAKITSHLAKGHDKPCYLRIDKSKLIETNIINKINKMDHPRAIIESKNSKLIILSTAGILEHCKEAIKSLSYLKIQCDLYSVFNITKINKKFLNKLKFKKVLVVEENIKENSLFYMILDHLKSKNVHSMSINKNNIFYQAGDQNYIRDFQKISKKNIINKIKKLI